MKYAADRIFSLENDNDNDEEEDDNDDDVGMFVPEAIIVPPLEAPTALLLLLLAIAPTPIEPVALFASWFRLCKQSKLFKPTVMFVCLRFLLVPFPTKVYFT